MTRVPDPLRPKFLPCLIFYPNPDHFPRNWHFMPSQTPSQPWSFLYFLASDFGNRDKCLDKTGTNFLSTGDWASGILLPAKTGQEVRDETRDRAAGFGL